jgi:hypothetical protein
MVNGEWCLREEHPERMSPCAKRQGLAWLRMWPANPQG